MSKLETIRHDCDILVVGGGLAGCMAAIRTGELNDRVVLVDKSNPERSGCAATGIDHIWAYFPEVQGREGVTLDDMVKDHVENFSKGLVHREMIRYIAETSLDRILDLEHFGVKMRYEDSTLPGKFRLQYQYHACRNTLHFDGRHVKPILTRTVRERKVQAVDRVMVTDLLLHDGQIAGAVGYGTRDGCLHLFHAKAVIMACGRPNRLYKTQTGVAFNTRMPPALTGDGKAAMFRGGAEIINMEFSAAPGTAFMVPAFVRGGGLPAGSFQPPGIGVNALGEVVKKRNHEIDATWDGVLTPGETGKTFMGELKAGRGPVFADMSWGSDEDQEYMRWSISNESGGWTLLHVMKQYGLDFRRHKIEIFPNDPEHSSGSACGPAVDRNCMTTLPGLYAAGDEAGGIPGSVVPGALTMGHLAAESAATFVKSFRKVPDGRGEVQVREFCRSILDRRKGDPWEDVQAAIQNIMSFYNIEVKSETMSARGLECLRYLKNTMRMTAGTPHEMTHCLEMRNLIENAEMILRATMERRESRGAQLKRADYPQQDDKNFFCWLAQRLDREKVVFEKRYPM